MDVREKTTSEKRLIDYYYLAEKIECPGQPLVYWDDIEAAPTVDAGVTYEDGKIIDVHIRDTDDVVKVFVPVRHGRWIDKGEYAVCTECGGLSGTQYDGVELIPLMTQFCPNCGAIMDGGAE